MKTPRATLALLLGLLALPACGPGDSDESRQAAARSQDQTEFLRFVEEGDGAARLETAIIRYQDGKNRVVDLIAAVHIADQQYYDELSTLFATYDSLLYEAVTEKDRRPGPGGDSPVSMLQRAMKRFLELEFQLEAVDYNKDNFVHADLEPAEFFALMKEKGENLFTLVLQAMLSEMKYAAENAAEVQTQQLTMMLALLDTKDRARSLKKALGKQFGDLERLAAGFEKGLKGGESVLVIERNKAALRAMEERLEQGDKKLAIFYGAAHMPDLERRLLRDFGFERKGETWVVAWDIPAKPADGGQ